MAADSHGMATTTTAAASCGQCGARLSSGAPWCGQCFAPAEPAERAWLAASPEPARPAPVPAAAGAPARRSGAVRTVFGVIGLNVAIQAATLAMVQQGNLEPSQAIRINLWVSLLFFGTVFVMAVSRANRDRIRPVWSRGDRVSSALVGVLAGLVASAGLVGLVRAATGEWPIDDGVALVVSERSITRVGLAVLVFVLVGPFVEELLCRGVLLEGLLHRGTTVALGASSALFAAAHLRGFVYYTLMGALFGVLYLKKGMQASVLAHAVFNGVLVVLALAAVSAPSRTVGAVGMWLDAPAAWKQTTGPEADGTDLYLVGPSAAELVVGHQPTGGPTPAAAVIAAAINRGDLPMGGVTADGPATVTEGPWGEAVLLRMQQRGRAGEMLVIPKGPTIWLVISADAGSSRAADEIDAMLASLELPDQPT